MLIQKLRHITIVTIAFLLLMLSFPIVALADTNDIQAQVLQVIQDHPQAILDSLVKYQQQRDAAKNVARTTALEDYRQNPDRLVRLSPVLGTRHAKATVVEFSDFQCPFCQQAHDDLQVFHKQQPDVRIVYKHLPLIQIHDQAMPAALAAWAASQQGKFWEYHDQLFAHQADLNEATLISIAQQLDLDRPRFDRDRVSATAMQAIADDRKLADTVGAEGTPLFVVLGKKSVEVISGASIAELEVALARVS
jgi:protein-disulfide isomerase